MYFGNKEKKAGIKRISGILLGLALLLLLRNFLLLLIIPAVIAWLVSNKWPQRGLASFAIVYAVFCILFFTLRYVDPRLDFPKAVVDKQQAFMEMIGGNSSIPIRQLKPDAISFLKNVPQAITLSILKPYPGDVRHLLLLAAAVEINLLLLFFLISLIWPQKKISMSNNLVYFCLFFGLSLLLSVGFSVNNLGAIVRYRSVAAPLLVVLIAIRIDWEKIAKLSIKNIRFKNNITDVN
jgi:hypothetical protein